MFLTSAIAMVQGMARRGGDQGAEGNDEGGGAREGLMDWGGGGGTHMTYQT